MSEYRALLEQARRQFPPPDITVETIADRGRRRQRNRRAGAIVMALTLLAGALAGLKALGDIRPGPRPADLPSAPESWSRVWIEQTPAGEDGFARPQEVFVAGSRLVAWGIRAPVVIRPGEPASDPAAWESTDGRTWSQAPVWPEDEEGPDLSTPVPVPAGPELVSLSGQQVWLTDDALTWEQGPVDPDLSEDTTPSLLATEQGLVAVGGAQAWLSSDGLDWQPAAVPALPADLLREEAYNDYFEDFSVDKLTMRAVAASPDRLVAVGSAVLEWDLFTDEPLERPVIWTSTDGRTWTETPIDPAVFPPGEAGANPEGGPGIRIIDPGSRIDHIAWGPGGFVAIGSEGGDVILSGPEREAAIAVWTSPDGIEWERVRTDAFASRYPGERQYASAVLFGVNALTAGPAGYVAVGVDGGCRRGYDPPVPCPSPAEAVVWTSSDGRMWSRVPSGAAFRAVQPGPTDGPPETEASSVVTWGSRFLVVGTYDGGPAAWISRPPDA